MRRPRRIRSEVVRTYPYLSLVEHDLEGPAGLRTIVTLDLQPWCCVAARAADGRWVLVEQHRHGVDDITLEVAGGIIDAGESPEIAAIRELEEETGFARGVCHALDWVHPNPALSDNRAHIFFVDGVTQVAEPQVSAQEETEVVLLDAAELDAALKNGRITHALTFVALGRALERARLGG